MQIFINTFSLLSVQIFLMYTSKKYKMAGRPTQFEEIAEMFWRVFIIPMYTLWAAV